jgi:nitroimidazol reductase NimA-like FMN-containing flavoprotein (pyridoxamine 5'-phosphate oxidase superfamily)
MKNAQLARKIIDDNKYMTLATCKDTMPWVAPLFFATDKNFNFYFLSGKEARHVIEIKGNPNVALSIYDSREIPERADGVYIEGVASQVPLKELLSAMNLLYKKRFPNPRELKEHLHSTVDFLGDKPRRFFKVVPKHIYKLDQENSSEVDKKVEIDISTLKAF